MQTTKKKNLAELAKIKKNIELVSGSKFQLITCARQDKGLVNLK